MDDSNSEIYISTLVKKAENNDSDAIYQLALHYYEKLNDITYALQWLEKGIILGNLECYHLAAKFYFYGWGCELNYQKAFDYWKYNALHGDSRAQFLIAEILFEGTCQPTIPADINTAIQWYQKAIQNHNNEKAIIKLGKIYLEGNQVSPNINKGIEILKYGHRQKFLNASLALANYWRQKKEYLKAVELLMSYPHDLNCQVEISYCYYLHCLNNDIDNSYSVSKSENMLTTDNSDNFEIKNKNLRKIKIKHKSIEILKDAANQNSPLAWFYLSEIVKDKNKNQQIKCLLMSFQLGYSLAKNKMDQVIQELIDTKDPDNILHQMGKLLLQDNTIQDNFNLAINFFMYSLEAGYLNNYHHIGNTYQKINKQDQAVIFWKKGIKYQNVFCYSHLGEYYLHINPKKSFYYYQEAAKLGYSPAQYTLSMMLMEGIGCDKNISESLEWLEKSAQQEYHLAINKVIELKNKIHHDK